MSTLSSALLRVISHRREIPIRDCVHYCGFRYGRNERNPYEQYQKGLAAGLSRAQLRAEFVDFLRYYRPRTLGEALGVQLSRDYPLWQLPWQSRFPARRSQRTSAWVDDPSDVVDVMTHFSAKGIPAQLVEDEHAWHERAFLRMSSDGYRPGLLNHARVVVLEGPSRAAYLVTDGNHRISALSALGVASVMATCIRGRTVYRDRVQRWPLVRSGKMTQEDALAIFDLYHRGNREPPRALTPSELVAR